VAVHDLRLSQQLASDFVWDVLKQIIAADMWLYKPSCDFLKNTTNLTLELQIKRCLIQSLFKATLLFKKRTIKREELLKEMSGNL
jgi:hypothetical protein